MTQFAYTAIPVAGAGAALVTGRREAPDERSLRDELRHQGLVAIDVRPVHMIDAVRAALSSDRLRRADAVWFFQTLRMLLSGAVPIETALTTMHDLAPRPRLRAVCAVVREKLRSGASLADAVSAAPGLASSQHLALLRSGHESGRLAHAVTLIDASMATGQRLRQALVSRLIYPLILIIVAIIAVWFLAVVVIPKFASALAAMGAELPLPTRITLGGARSAIWAGPALLLAVLIAWGTRSAWVTPRLRARVAGWMLRAPVVGTLIAHSQAAAVTDVLATMIEGGADVLAGMAQAQEVVSSPVIAERLAAARRQVREGVDLGQALAQQRVLPPMIGAVVQVGIRSGDLVGSLRRATEACLEHQQRLTDRLMVLLEPAVILMMAIAVGWVVYSLIVGMLAMNDLQAL